MTDNLTSKTLHGLKWSYASTITRTFLQIGFTAIMARLLEPAAFGLVAMAGVVLRFGTYFAQMGVGSALIQKKDVTDQDIRAAFTSSIFLSILFCVIIWFSAPLAVYIFDSQKVVPIIRVMAFSFILTGLTTTALSLLRRNLRFRSLAIAEILSYVLGYGGIGIVLAYNGFGVWSLVMAALSQSALMAVFSYVFSRHKLSFIFRWRYYKPLYSFGSRVSVISFFEFLGSNLDTLMIGRFVGASPLGIYNRAFMLVNLPAQHLTSSFSRVLFPSFSRVQKETARLKKAYLSTIMLFSALLLPTCLGMAAASREIVLLVLGENWAAAIPVLQILAIAAPLNLLSHFGGIVCEATATLNIKLLMQIVYIFLLAILFYSIRGLGIREFAMAIAFGEFIRFVGYLFIVKRICNIRFMEYVHVLFPSVVSSLTIGVSIYFVATLLRGLEVPLILLFAAELFTGAGLLIIIFLYGPQQILRKELSERLKHSGIFSRNRFFSWFYQALSAD